MSQTLSANPVWTRLINPKESVTFDALATNWKQERLTISIAGYGILAMHERLLFKLRGAIGQALFRSASPEAIAGKPCPWLPPCACDVFYTHKPHVDIPTGRQVVPKPFVLSSESSGQDLILHITIFGFACEWLAHMRAAVTAAIRELMPWELLGENIFLPTRQVIRVKNSALPLQDTPNGSEELSLNFITPFDCSNFDPLDRPNKLIFGIANRAVLMARWQEKRIEADWARFIKALETIDFEIEPKDSVVLKRRSRRNQNSYKTLGRTFELRLSGELGAITPIVMIGQAVHAGMGAAFGLGKFEIANL